MTHATERAEERLRDTGINPATVLDEAARIARHLAPKSAAVRMRVLPETRGDDHPDLYVRASNGNEVWAVLRDGLVKTLDAAP